MNELMTYKAAQVTVLKIEKEVRELAEAGNHKLKNNIINEQLRKANIAKNKAHTAIIKSLDKMAEEIARRV